MLTGVNTSGVRGPIRVLVVDDSALVRRILSEAITADPELTVVGTAGDCAIAAQKIASLKPDVLTLDIEMPGMDGITFLRQLMSTAPIPVIIISSIAQRGARAALEAMEAGAVEVLAKPSGPYSVGELKQTIGARIRAAAHARLRTITKPRTAPQPVTMPVVAGATTAGSFRDIVAIGASTGGTEAIRHVLQALPSDSPPIVVVQHIPPVFSRSFAERLNELCAIRVREASEGDFVERGLALIAPGDKHMVVHRTAGRLRVLLKDGPRVCYQRPSVDVLFQSVAETVKGDAVGVILTGMGNDGAAGLLKMRQAGAHTIAQDEESCVVYGMPKEAARTGAVVQVLPLGRVAEAICAATHRRMRAAG